MTKPRFSNILVLFTFLALLLAACGTSGSGSTPAGTAQPAGQAAGDHCRCRQWHDRQAQPRQLWWRLEPAVNYNPFSPNVLIGNYIYEPLLVANSFACKYEPWLATAYEWKDPQNLQFTIREGIKWSDGQPFTPDDVVFTLNMLKEHAALDTQGLWKTLESVTAEGNNVLFKFKEPAASLFERVASQLIVPKHIWEKEADPVTFVNEKRRRHRAVHAGKLQPAPAGAQAQPELLAGRQDQGQSAGLHQSRGRQPGREPEAGTRRV